MTAEPCDGQIEAMCDDVAADRGGFRPCLDCNGRIGRLLVTLCPYHCVYGVLRMPLLYLSLYLRPIAPTIIDCFMRSANAAPGRLDSLMICSASVHG
jgi:hypothetical protein